MNTNSNLYTVIYTTIIVVVVAAVLAFVSMSLKSKQEANEKAETISQMLVAAGYDTKEAFQAMGNQAIIEFYKEHAVEAFTVNSKGEKVADIDVRNAGIFTVSELKAQNKIIKDNWDKPAGTEDASGLAIPVFRFDNNTTVFALYGAGLWGPIWGWMAFEPDMDTIVGAYFDHESETPGLGAKIKDDQNFQHSFDHETIARPLQKKDDISVLEIVKGGAPKQADGSAVLGDHQIDAISGATMTGRGLQKAIDSWLDEYSSWMNANAVHATEVKESTEAPAEVEPAEKEEE